MAGEIDRPAESSLLPAVLRSFENDGIVASDTGLTFTNPDLSWDRYQELAEWLGDYGQALKRADAAYLFWVGDTLNAGFDIFGEEGAQVTDVFERRRMSYQRQMNVQSVCRRVPKDRRRDGVYFEHHAEVASLQPNDQRRWLKIAAVEGISKSELRLRINAEKEGHPDVIDPSEPEICPTCNRPL